ncbi:hypothetical protein LTR62_004966 [Meristemomyces frigidus]|uniref:J domain-containing protein n=1 Tax=Meristemomyces frigidus TaxID=1508187 RepID=A0AAN7TQU7_9PEZI|nr:hypothetical protein LTR62_004966 [Meristemomyces frigidus]
MRRQITKAVQDGSKISRSAASAAPIWAQPFICAKCRRAGAPIPVSKSVVNHYARPFLTTRRVPQQASPAAESSRSSNTAVPQTHYDFFPQTFPRGPPPASPFTPDLKQLRKEFLQLQSKAHPDLAPANQKRQAEALSSRVNEAYKVLQDPLKRAQYLLLQAGIDVEDESAKLSGGELLMEVMEAREAVDEVEKEEDLGGVRRENDGRIEQSVGVLEQAFARGDLNAAAQEAIRLRYWVNIGESIQGWEKGSGGGAVHH